MDAWDVAQAKVQEYELEIEILDEDYRRIKNQLEEERMSYEERLHYFNAMTDIKYEEAMADFRNLEVEDERPFTDTVTDINIRVQNAFIDVFNYYSEQFEELDTAYKKTYSRVSDKLEAAYSERRKLS
ncbi:hypothetical protein [Streptococcus macacae]|uniref:Uncharacterized protein n=1 Tax=Streptococcus macacae NCTC 11558 TaxID=764298 RepID=G5JVQ8_9STRE|nr:hypothetical protein [Streptococcus macacae]EHJ51573.1 hypothetical protein STRMA_0914 [Streptococcus macacae NCTC 11558]SUN78724.1 Uncharacterised protein [Streptococcus macacae NCTC 11558]